MGKSTKKGSGVKTQIRQKSEEEMSYELMSLEYQIRQTKEVLRERKKITEEASKTSSIERRITTSLEQRKNLLEQRLKIVSSIFDIEQALLNKNLTKKEAGVLRARILQHEAELRQNEFALKMEELKSEEIQRRLERRKKAAQEASDNSIKFINDIFGALNLKLVEFFNKFKSSSYRFIKFFAITLTSEILQVFAHLNKEFNDLRKNLGLIRSDVSSGKLFGITTGLQNIYSSLYRYGVDLQHITQSVEDISNITGGFNNLNKELLSTSSLIAANFNVSTKAISGFLSKVSGLSKVPLQTSKNVLLFAREITKELGVKYSDIISDISEMGDTTLSIISRIPSKMVLIASELRKMGTTINTVSQSAERTLDFMENIQEELAASVLIGKNINLQEIRRLYYQGELSKAYEEILKIAEQIHFEELNFYQKKQFAQATGLSVENILNSLQIKRNIELSKQKGILSKEIEIIEKAKRLKEEDLQKEGELNEKIIKRQANLARIEMLNREFQELFIELGSLLYPVVDTLLKISILLIKISKLAIPLIAVFSAISKISPPIQSMFLGIGKTIVNIGKNIASWGAELKNYGKIISKLAAPLTFILSKLPMLFRFLGIFGKVFTGPIGWIITLGDVIHAFFKNLEEGKGILESLFYALIKPFTDVYEFIKGLFFPGSPSKVGKEIIKGFENTGEVLEKVLPKPWESLNAKTEKIMESIDSQYGKVFDKISSNLPEVDLFNKPANSAQMQYSYPKPAQLGASLSYKSTSGEYELGNVESQNQLLKEILQSINILNDNLKNGNIRIYMDGQLVNQVIARENAFSKGYGLMNI